VKGKTAMQSPVIRQILVGPFDTMTYLAACPETREAVVIDPAGRFTGHPDSVH
jgi:hypothetical protein